MIEFEINEQEFNGYYELTDKSRFVNSENRDFCHLDNKKDLIFLFNEIFTIKNKLEYYYYDKDNKIREGVDYYNLKESSNARKLLLDFIICTNCISNETVKYPLYDIFKFNCSYDLKNKKFFDSDFYYIKDRINKSDNVHLKLLYINFLYSYIDRILKIGIYKSEYEFIKHYMSILEDFIDGHYPNKDNIILLYKVVMCYLSIIINKGFYKNNDYGKFINIYFDIIIINKDNLKFVFLLKELFKEKDFIKYINEDMLIKLNELIDNWLSNIKYEDYNVPKIHLDLLNNLYDCGFKNKSFIDSYLDIIKKNLLYKFNNKIYSSYIGEKYIISFLNKYSRNDVLRLLYKFNFMVNKEHSNDLTEHFIPFKEFNLGNIYKELKNNIDMGDFNSFLVYLSNLNIDLNNNEDLPDNIYHKIKESINSPLLDICNISITSSGMVLYNKNRFYNENDINEETSKKERNRIEKSIEKNRIVEEKRDKSIRLSCLLQLISSIFEDYIEKFGEDYIIDKVFDFIYREYLFCENMNMIYCFVESLVRGNYVFSTINLALLNELYLREIYSFVNPDFSPVYMDGRDYNSDSVVVITSILSEENDKEVKRYFSHNDIELYKFILTDTHGMNLRNDPAHMKLDDYYLNLTNSFSALLCLLNIIKYVK